MDKNFKIPVSWSFKSFRKDFTRESNLLRENLRLMGGQCWDCRGAWCCHCPEGQQSSAGGSSREDGCWPYAQAGLQEGSVEWGTPFLRSLEVSWWPQLSDAQVVGGEFRLWRPKLPWAGGGQRAGFDLAVHSSVLKILQHTPCNLPCLCQVTSSNYW